MRSRIPERLRGPVRLQVFSGHPHGAGITRVQYGAVPIAPAVVQGVRVFGVAAGGGVGNVAIRGRRTRTGIEEKAVQSGMLVHSAPGDSQNALQVAGFVSDDAWKKYVGVRVNRIDYWIVPGNVDRIWGRRIPLKNADVRLGLSAAG